jgi:DNA-binding ferritin-like protein (Dps family)
MANMVEKLRKENNESDKQLLKENSLIMTDMVVYLRSSNLRDYDIEVIRRELFGMIYEAQLREESARQVIGNNYKEFCEELMKSGRQKGLYEKFLEWAYVGTVGFGSLLLIEVLFTGFLFQSILHGKLIMDFSAGFIISTLMIVAEAEAFYWFFTKYTFELSVFGLTKYKIIFIAGFALYFGATVLIKLKLDDSSLFQMNILIPAVIIASLYGLIKILGDRYADQTVKTH